MLLVVAKQTGHWKEYNTDSVTLHQRFINVNVFLLRWTKCICQQTGFRGDQFLGAYQDAETHLNRRFASWINHWKPEGIRYLFRTSKELNSCAHHGSDLERSDLCSGLVTFDR